MSNPEERRVVDDWRSKSLRLLPPFLVFVLTVVTFLPSLQNEFVDWDDDANFLENPYYRGLGWEQLRWMFTTFHQGHYQPLSWLTLGLDYFLGGMNPLGYHLTSLLLHAANAVLFYFVALRLLRVSTAFGLQEPGVRIAAGFSALLFSVHPLRVESVAWVTERRDVLAAFFLLWSILCYLRAAAARAKSAYRWWLSGAILIYALSLLSKAQGMTLPAVLLVLDIYPLKRIGGGPGRWWGPESRKVWWEKAPFFLLALGAGLVALVAQYHTGAMKTLGEHGISSRIAQSLYGLVFYLWKTIFPVNLSPLYQLPVHFNPWDWRFLLSGLGVLGITLALLAARQRWPAGLVTWICYGLILAPVLGVAQSGLQLVADRYSYVSCLGWAVLAGAGIVSLWKLWLTGRIKRSVFLFANGLAAAILLWLGSLTWQQTQVWNNSERLWKYTVAVTDKSFSRSPGAHYNLGNVLSKKGNLEEAMTHYREALQIKPSYPEAHNNLARALARGQQWEQAQEHFQQAVKILPEYAEARSNLGNVLMIQGDAEAAIREFREALRIEPTLHDTRYNLGLALTQTKRFREAKVEFQDFIHNKPDLPEAHYYLGIVLVTEGDFPTGIAELREALKLQPKFADAHIALARVLTLQGNREEAIQHYQEGLRILKEPQGSP